MEFLQPRLQGNLGSQPVGLSLISPRPGCLRNLEYAALLEFLHGYLITYLPSLKPYPFLQSSKMDLIEYLLGDG